MKFYLRIEGVNLNNFVYDTQDLSTIRGSGLAILEAVNLLEDKEIIYNNSPIKLKRISSGASTGLFSFETAGSFNTKDFADSVKDVLINNKSLLQFATFVIDVIEESNDFQTDREKTLAQNRWQQMQSPRLAIPKFDNTPTNTSFKRASCEVDSVRRAEIEERVKDGDKEISVSIFERRKFGKDEKQRFIKREIKDYFDISRIKHKFAYDFDELTVGKKNNYNTTTDKGNLHHKMAVIYIDGNDFGSKQRKLSPEQLGKFDKLKSNYQREFLAGLMRKIVDDKDHWQYTGENETVYQLEILLWGGDEICLVVPAWKGWETLELFYETTKNLESEFLESDDKKLTHSTGIVFCHHNAPIRRIKNLAEDLAGLAKDKSRKKNLFAYEILESFDHISKDLENHRKSRSPQIDPINEKVLILDGEKISQIKEQFQNIQSFLPRRKLTQIVFNLLSPIEDAAKKEKQKALIEDLIESVKKSVGENKSQLDKFVDLFENSYTAWIHANELWDYIEEAK